MSTKSIYKESTKIKVKEPKRYKVVMLNDDFTSMEFVVFILTNIFKKPHTEAINIMMTVHKVGSAIVGVYSYDIAMTKVDETIALARTEGFPFRLNIEEA